MTVAGSVDPAVTVRGTKATGDRRVVPGLISGASLGQNRSLGGPKRAECRPKTRDGKVRGSDGKSGGAPSSSAGRCEGPLADGFFPSYPFLPSARSGDIFGNGQMLVMWTVKGSADAICQFVGAEQAVGFHHPSLAVDPLRLYRIEPRTLLGKQAGQDAYPAPALLDLPVVRGYPLSDLFGGVPRSVVPDKEPHLLASRLESLAAPRKEPRRYRAHRATIHKAQPHLLKLRQIKPIARDGLRIRVVFGDRLLDETHGLTRLCPTIEGGQSQPAPPSLVFETYHPSVGIVVREADQPVAPPFFLAYSGSGEVIQRLARSQRTPIRESVARMVSPLTRSFVSPSSKLTSAAISIVHRLLCLPNSRGLLCNNSRRTSARSGSKAR